jgi:hypothetical protein
MTDPVRNRTRPPVPPPVPPPVALAPELEARIAAFETAAPASGFGAAGWFWMLLLGVVIPLAMLIVGWWV